MSMLKKVSRGTSRMKQKALERMGKAEGTIDLQMQQHKDRFEETYESIQKLSKDSNDLMIVMKRLSVAQAVVAADIHELFQTQDTFYNTALKLQDSTRFVDDARQLFDDTLHEDMLEPISIYLGQYKEMKHRIDTYDTRRVDQDRYAAEVRKAQEKGKYAELPHKEEKLRAAKANYSALHEELMVDLPAMEKDKIAFIPLVVATYVTAYCEYFRSAAKSMAESRAMIDSLDTQAVHGAFSFASLHSLSPPLFRSFFSVLFFCSPLWPQLSLPVGFLPSVDCFFICPPFHVLPAPHRPLSSAGGLLTRSVFSRFSGLLWIWPYRCRGPPTPQPRGFVPLYLIGYPHTITPLDESSVKNFQIVGGGEVTAGDSSGEEEDAPKKKEAKSKPAPAPKAAPKPKAPPSRGPKGPTATANFDFEAQEDNELPFKKGDTLTILSQDGDWWDAELNGAKGMIPANYVQMN
jgi:amphiphysin